ncbi:MAG: hypothetical protein MUC82_00785 [Cypionkella sp.]|jgi:hypothetical protein|nr:hypothetical protein [Cypionkella sp.]
MLDDRFDPAFHQAFISSEAHPVELPVPSWGLVLIMLSAIGIMATLCALSLP